MYPRLACQAESQSQAAIKTWHIVFEYFTQYESDIALMKCSNKQMQNVWDIVKQWKKWSYITEFKGDINDVFVVKMDYQSQMHRNAQTNTSKQQLPVILHLSGNMGWMVADKH